mmetsp:Transcript_20535/g.41002  ORF Transcript_20535/g.41002 Transcript_20535/m.41002 type:complete len:452 (-) Transcript_20535:233-1588(-)
MPSTPPPPAANVGMKSPIAAAAGLPVAANLTDGTIYSPSFSRNYAATNCGSIVIHAKTFAQKIHKLLELPNYSSIISWNDSGTVVIIHDVEAFITTIMPVHFKQSKFGSFVRRMRRWGFSVIKQRSSSSKSSSSTSGRGQCNVMEFSSEHFIRDQPNLCLLMKDERQVKKKFTFKDPNDRKKGDDGVEHVINQGSTVGGRYVPPFSVEGGTVMPSFEEKTGVGMMLSVENTQAAPVHYPPSLSNMNAANNLPSSNAAINDGYLHSYSQEDSMSSHPSMNQYAFQPTMPAMNMMIPPPPPPHYPQCGFGQSPPSAFQYPHVYPPYLQHQQQQHDMMHQIQLQQQHYQMMQQQHQMMQQSQQQQEMMQLNQQQQEMHYSPPPTYPVDLIDVAVKIADSATPNANDDVKDDDVKASTASVNATLLSSSSEESNGLDLLPNYKIHTSEQVQSRTK